MIGRTLTLASVGERALAQAHQDYVRARVALYRDRAKQALKLARIALRHGDAASAGGMLDTASVYRSMANGLEQQAEPSYQQTNFGESR
jgi:hypothetical protein